MFDHIGIDVTDLARSKEFYSKALAPLGHSLVMDLPEYGAAGFGTKRPQFWIGADGSFGKNGTGDEIHVAFAARSRNEVDQFYAAAIAAGGRDNGKPGLRPEYHENYYGAFVLDPDGVNLEAVFHG